MDQSETKPSSFSNQRSNGTSGFHPIGGQTSPFNGNPIHHESSDNNSKGFFNFQPNDISINNSIHNSSLSAAYGHATHSSAPMDDSPRQSLMKKESGAYNATNTNISSNISSFSKVEYQSSAATTGKKRSRTLAVNENKVEDILSQSKNSTP